MDTATDLDGVVLRSDAARNRTRLLEAARQLLAEGDSTLRLNTLARCAGVGVGTAYRHFPDRQTLVEGLAAAALTVLVEDARAAATEPDPALGLERLLAAALTAMADDPVLAEVLRAPSPVCVQTIGLSQELGAAIQVLLRRSHDARLIRDDLGPDDLRRQLVGLHAAAEAGSQPAAARQRYLSVLLAGLRASPPDPRP